MKLQIPWCPTEVNPTFEKKTSVQVHKLIYIFSSYLIFHPRTLKNTDHTADWTLTAGEELEMQKSPPTRYFSRH